MKLTGFEITQIMDCIADSTKMRIVASLSNPVEDVFPLLNATVKNITYNHNAEVVVLKRGYRLITIHRDFVTIAKADDLADAEQTLAWLQELINSTWERRTENVCL